MGVDGRLVTTPATWKITFSGREGINAWRSARLRFGNYSVERTVLRAATSCGAGAAPLDASRTQSLFLHATPPQP